MNTQYSTNYTNTKQKQSVGSSFIAGNNMSVASNNNIDIVGSILAIQNGEGAGLIGITLNELYQGLFYDICYCEYNPFTATYWKDSGQGIREAINASNGIIQPAFQSKADLSNFNNNLLNKRKND